MAELSSEVSSADLLSLASIREDNSTNVLPVCISDGEDSVVVELSGEEVSVELPDEDEFEEEPLVSFKCLEIWVSLSCLRASTRETGGTKTSGNKEERQKKMNFKSRSSFYRFHTHTYSCR